ncbi:MAG TPA: hypothetical protein PLB62_00045 [Candidatus Sumerlaeota bacterium]|nr:hypothetical protein [Candidatus Sumerlaeota bacterium]
MKRMICVFLFCLAAIVTSAQEPIYRTITPLPAGRQMYGVAVVGDWLYIIGGNMEPDIYTRAVEKARINPDGSIGPWENTTPLPSPRSYINNTTLVLGNVIYVVQGLNGETDEKRRSIFWTRAGADGHLAEWRESFDCPGAGVSCSVAVATPGYIHLIGGSTGGSKPTAGVWSARLGQDGAVMGWEVGSALPVPLWFHNGGICRGRVWVWGGLADGDPKSCSRNIYWAPILPTGQIGSWQVLENQMDVGLYSASCAVSGDFLLSFCPRYQDTQTNGDVWYSIIGPDGPSSWELVRAQIPSKLYTGVAADPQKGYVYLPGGRPSRENYILDANVYCFALAVPKDSAVMSRGSEPAAHQQTPGQVSQVSDAPAQIFVPLKKAVEMFNQQARPTVILFHHDGNPASRSQMEALAGFPFSNYTGRIIFTMVNPYESPELASQYGATSLPTWVFFNSSGALLKKMEGSLSTEAVVAAANQCLQ